MNHLSKAQCFSGSASSLVDLRTELSTVFVDKITTDNGFNVLSNFDYKTL